MSDDETKEKILNFLKILQNRRGMVLGGETNSLDRFEGFVYGLKWSAHLRGENLVEFLDFIQNINVELSKEFIGSSAGVGWMEQLLIESDMDEEIAFQKLMERVSSLVQDSLLKR